MAFYKEIYTNISFLRFELQEECFRPMRQTIKEYRIPIIVISVVLVVALVGTSLWLLLGHSSDNTQSTHSGSATKTTAKTAPTQTPTPQAVPVSPLLFGTNLALFDNQLYHNTDVTSTNTCTDYPHACA